MKLNMQLSGEPGQSIVTIDDKPVFVYALDVKARPQDVTKITMQVYAQDMSTYRLKFIGCSEHDHELLELVRSLTTEELDVMNNVDRKKVAEIITFLREERAF